MPLLDVADQESIHLRFKIGDRVLCWHGTWLPSTIVKLFYVQPNFPPGKCVPYKVKLDDGREIYAKADVDTVVREFAESGTGTGARLTNFFKEMISYPQRDDFELLNEQVAYARVSTSHICPREALRHIESIRGSVDLLLSAHVLLSEGVNGHRNAPTRIKELEGIIDCQRAKAHWLVHRLKCYQFRRLLAVIRIQRTMLRILYAPASAGKIPLISRPLLSEFFIGDGDSEGDDE